MTGLPEWAEDVAGFDPARWWLPVVCIGRKHAHHPFEVLGIVFDHADGRGIHWGGPHIALTQAATTKPLPPPSPRPDRPALRTHTTSLPGSLNITCPACDRTPRVSRGQWSKRISEARHAALPWVDVSTLD